MENPPDSTTLLSSVSPRPVSLQQEEVSISTMTVSLHGTIMAEQICFIAIAETPAGSPHTNRETPGEKLKESCKSFDSQQQSNYPDTSHLEGQLSFVNGPSSQESSSSNGKQNEVSLASWVSSSRNHEV